MKLNTKSWWVYYYKWIYSSIILPSNLCPLFWKLLLAFLLLPLELILCPIIIIGAIIEMKNDKRVYKSHSYPSNKFDRMIVYGIGDILINPVRYFVGIGIYLMLTLLFCAVAIFFTDNKDVNLFGIIGWVIILLISIVSIIMYIYQKIENSTWENQKEKKTYILTEFLKSSYKKYCPQITWKNE